MEWVELLKFLGVCRFFATLMSVNGHVKLCHDRTITCEGLRTACVSWTIAFLEFCLPNELKSAD